jgi:Fur family ferric uptake transcriptional regulator
MTDRPARQMAGTQARATELTAEDVVAILRASGGRSTAVRRATIEVLFAAKGEHLGAEEVAHEVRKRLPEAADSTIYRALFALEKLNLVTHVHLGHGPSTFHLNGQGHRHLVCVRCGSVTEVPAGEFTPIVRRLESEYGFHSSAEHFAIPGTCRKCVEASVAQE